MKTVVRTFQKILLSIFAIIGIFTIGSYIIYAISGIEPKSPKSLYMMLFIIPALECIWSRSTISWVKKLKGWAIASTAGCLTCIILQLIAASLLFYSTNFVVPLLTGFAGGPIGLLVSETILVRTGVREGIREIFHRHMRLVSDTAAEIRSKNLKK